jgi:hypothetical protein
MQMQIDKVICQNELCFLGAGTDGAGQQWLVMHQRRPQTAAWLCAAISPRMLEELEAGRAAPRDIFRHSVTGTVEMVTPGDRVSEGCLASVRCADLPDSWLSSLPRCARAVPLQLADPAITDVNHRDLESLGEALSVAERVVVSPAVGVFHPEERTQPDGRVESGTLLGTVGMESVRSPFSGELMGMLAYPGERVQVGQPIAWLRAADAA